MLAQYLCLNIIFVLKNKNKLTNSVCKQFMSSFIDISLYIHINKYNVRLQILQFVPLYVVLVSSHQKMKI